MGLTSVPERRPCVEAGLVLRGPTDVTGPDPAESPPPELTALVTRARRGLRRDVAALEAGLDDAELYLPLQSHVAGAPEGEAVALDRELEILPHLLRDEDGRGYAALFTSPALVEPIAESLGWQTDGRELSVCSLPGRVAFELSLGVIDEQTVFGLVIDPGQPSELFLRRAELASLVAGQPVPLVGYLADLPPLEDEHVMLAEPSDPPPPALVEALVRCLAELPAVTSHRLERTYNPERDLEPHLTLRLGAAESADHRALARHVIDAVGELVPPPGYIDILFDDA